VTFETEKGAKKANNYDGHKFYNRKLRVTIAEKKEEIEEKRMKDDKIKKTWGSSGDKLEEEVKNDFKERKKGRKVSRSRSKDHKGKKHHHKKHKKDKKKRSSRSSSESDA